VEQLAALGAKVERQDIAENSARVRGLMGF
jgi:hypothetical protein